MDKYSFARIPRANIGRSSFDMSFTHKTTFNAGKLIPVYFEEVLPGDSWNCDVNAFCRLTSPLSVPILDNLYLDFHFFFVPTRLTWKNWERFNGAQDNPGDSTDFLIPRWTWTNSVKPGGLADYFGIPIGVTNISSSILPFRAYWLVWNNWFRDENLQDSCPVEMGDRGNVVVEGSSFAWWAPAPRGKRKDYLTSCLPWPQKGPGVELPLGTTAPVLGNGLALGLTNGSANGGLLSKIVGVIDNPGGFTASSTAYGAAVGPTSEGASGSFGNNLFGEFARVGVTTDPEKSGLIADLSSATAATINSLRMAFAMQQLFEATARSGSRYIEILYGLFGVVSPDARLQIPEYLGGFSQPMIINPVAQTSSTDGASPQGNLSAYGVAAASRKGFTKSFTEHGFLIGVCSVRADLSYSQGLARFWSRRTREDFYVPQLAHLGEQAVLNKEIYAQGTAEDDDVFGYNERWSELRYHQNMVTGLMRPQAENSLAIWNLTQNFAALPRLNSEFIVENPPIDRVSAVPDQPDFMLDVYFKQVAARPMPVYSTPAQLGRF